MIIPDLFLNPCHLPMSKFSLVLVKILFISDLGMNLQENKKMFKRVSFISVNMNDFA